MGGRQRETDKRASRQSITSPAFVAPCGPTSAPIGPTPRAPTVHQPPQRLTNAWPGLQPSDSKDRVARTISDVRTPPVHTNHHAALPTTGPVSVQRCLWCVHLLGRFREGEADMMRVDMKCDHESGRTYHPYPHLPIPQQPTTAND